MKTKLFTLFLVLATSAGTMLAQVHSNVKIGDLYYNLKETDLTAEVISGSGSSIVFPESVTYGTKTYGVTSIGDLAFYYNKSINSISIPNCIWKIGSSAFNGCTNLSSVTFNVDSIDGYLRINEDAFYDCNNLTAVHIPSIESWLHISFARTTSNPLRYAHNLYVNGNLATDIVIDGDIYEEYGLGIPDCAFSGCTSLTSISGDYVQYIGASAFADCTNLISATFPSLWQYGEEIEACTFANCYNLTSFTIPDDVTGIGQYAFYNCRSLKSITIPEGVTSIGDEAFAYCTGFTSITIPSSVTAIRGSYHSNPFLGCDNITTVVWNAKNSNACKFGSQVDTFIFGDSVEIIPDTLCKGMNKLTSVTIPVSATKIGADAFKDCTNITSVKWNAKNCSGYEFGRQIESFIFGPKVQKIPYGLCYRMEKLTSIVLPNGLKEIGEYAFYGCTGLTSMEIPNSVTSLGRAAFTKCDGLVTIKIPDGIKQIDREIFYGCKNLTSVCVGNSVTEFDLDAIKDCWHLTSLICYTTTPPKAYLSVLDTASIPFYQTILYVPKESLSAYRTADEWKKFTTIKPIPAVQSTETTVIKTTTTENSVDVTWPSVTGAASYELVIKDKEGNVICTLIFNSDGQLTSIAFSAPSRDGAPQRTQTEGFAFTVTGLEAGTEYNLTITAKNEAGQELDKKNISFHTESPEGIENLHADSDKPVKVLMDGQIYILRGKHIFDTQGKMVR